jgi:hypothetical protein
MSQNIKVNVSISNNEPKRYELFEFIKSVFCCDGKCEFEVEDGIMYLQHNGYTSGGVEGVGLTILESEYKNIINSITVESEFGEIFES